MKIRSTDILFKLILLTPITMLFQRAFDSINRILIGGILILLLIKVIKSLKRKDLLLLLSAGAIFLYSFFNIDSRFFSANMLCYYPLWFLYMIYISYSYEKLILLIADHKKYIKSIILFWCVLVIISAFFSSSYEDGKFMSFSNGTFRFAPTALFISILIWVYCGISENRKFAVMMIIPFVSMAFTGCRTYTVLLLIFMLYVYYSYCRSKKAFFVSIIPIVGIMTIFLGKSMFFDKFMDSINNQWAKNTLDAITSGRSTFWSGEISMFFKASIVEQMFGGGLTASYVKNIQINGLAIFAHNDFLEMLNCHGLCGVLLYILSFIRCMQVINNRGDKNRLQGSICIGICMLNAFFNSLYCYPTAVLAIPFLRYALTFDFKKVKETEKILYREEVSWKY